MIRQASTSPQPTHGAQARAGFEDGRVGVILVEDVSCIQSSRTLVTGQRQERPGMLRHISDSFLGGTVGLIGRTSFTGAGLTPRSRKVSLESNRASGSDSESGNSVGMRDDLTYRMPSTRDLLERKIQEQDDRVKNLDHTRKKKDGDLRILYSEILTIKRQKLKDQYLRRLQVNKLKREYKAVAARVKVYRRDMHDQESLNGYAELIKGAAPTTADSAYVMRLQNQLGKAIKKMDMMQSQMDLIQQACDEVMDSLNEDIGDVIEEKCKVEVEMKEETETLKKEKDAMEKKYKEQWISEKLRHMRLKEEAEKMSNLDVSIDDKEEVRNAPILFRKQTEMSKGGIIDNLKVELERMAQEMERSEGKLLCAIRKKQEEINRMQKIITKTPQVLNLS